MVPVTEMIYKLMNFLMYLDFQGVAKGLHFAMWRVVLQIESRNANVRAKNSAENQRQGESSFSVLVRE